MTYNTYGKRVKILFVKMLKSGVLLHTQGNGDTRTEISFCLAKNTVLCKTCY